MKVEWRILDEENQSELGEGNRNAEGRTENHTKTFVLLKVCDYNCGSFFLKTSSHTNNFF